jgi:hypothetical protein
MCRERLFLLDRCLCLMIERARIAVTLVGGHSNSARDMALMRTIWLDATDQVIQAWEDIERHRQAHGCC